MDDTIAALERANAGVADAHQQSVNFSRQVQLARAADHIETALEILRKLHPEDR